MKKWVKIPDVLFFQEGPGVRNTQYTSTGVKLLNVANLVDGRVDLSTSDRYISEEEAYRKYRHFLCDAGDFIVASSGIKVEYVDRKMGFIDNTMLPLCMNTSTIRFKVLNPSELNIRYFMYYLKSFHFKEQLSRYITGSAQLNYGPSHLSKMVMPLVPIDEQQEIISLLDETQVLIELRKRQLEKLDTLIKARFVEMFGDVETNCKDWRKGYLRDHASVIVGYPFPSEGYSSEGIDIVGGYNLMQGYIQWEESKHWPDEKGFESYLLHANDIVMAMDRPWVNGGFKIARIDASHLPAILIQRTACIRGKDIEQEFLYYMLDTKRFAEHCNITGSLVPHISNKDINSYQIILPPREIQQQFSAFVSQVDKSKVVVQKALDEAQLLFDSLMQEYFG